jgi:hypothetical protein
MELRKGNVDNHRLTNCQADARQGLYASAMAAYLQWLAQRELSGRADWAAERSRLRDQFARGGVHARTSWIAADLMLGLKCFFDFAADSNVISHEERNAYVSRALKALRHGVERQADAQHDADPVRRYLGLLGAVLTGGHGHLCNVRGGQPENSALWGWGKNQSGDEVALGTKIGWVHAETGDIYLDPNLAYQAAQKLATTQGESIAQNQRTLHQRLKEAGRLKSYEEEKTTNRLTLEGCRRAVLHLPASALLGEGWSPDGQPGQQGENDPNPGTVTSMCAPENTTDPGHMSGQYGPINRNGQGAKPKVIYVEPPDQENVSFV